MVSSYRVIPIVHQSRVDPGETVEIEIYLAGHGDIPPAKLQAFHTQDELIDEVDPGSIQYAVSEKQTLGGNKTVITGHDALESVPIDTWSTTAFLPSSFFDEKSIPEEIAPTADPSEMQFQPRMSEVVHESEPPLLLQLEISDEARSGDYDIPIVLTYGEETAPAQDVETASIHVNSWVESNRFYLETAGLVGVVATIFALTGVIPL